MGFVKFVNEQKREPQERKETQDLQINNDDVRINAMKQAFKVMDNFDKLEEKYIQEFAKESVMSLKQEFNRVAKVVLMNIVPKTVSLPLVTQYNEWGINRYGPAKKHNYSSRFDSLEIQNLVGGDGDTASLRYKGYSDDDGNKLPEDYRELSDARKWIKASIEVVQKEKFRTRKRSIDRLKKLDKFLEKYEPLLKKNEGYYKVNAGKRLVYRESPYYGRSSAGWYEMDVELISSENSFQLSAIRDEGAEKNISEYRWRAARDEFPEAIAWGSIVDDFDELFEQLKELRQTKKDKVTEANEDMRKNFAKELLVAKAKDMG